MDKLKAVKFLVAVLTFLLVLGTLSALTLIYRRAGRMSKTLRQQPNSTSASPRAAGLPVFLKKTDNCIF